MSILLWTFAPLITLVFATGWAHWRNRPRGPIDAMDSISQYERFRAAIAAPNMRRSAEMTSPRRAPDEVDLRDPAEVARARAQAG